MANAISPCVRPSAAKAASPKLKKLLAERMLDSALYESRRRTNRRLAAEWLAATGISEYRDS